MSEDVKVSNHERKEIDAYDEIQWKEAPQEATDFDLKQFDEKMKKVKKVPDTYYSWAKAAYLANETIRPDDFNYYYFAFFERLLSIRIKYIFANDPNQTRKRQYNAGVNSFKKKLKTIQKDRKKWETITKKCLKAEDNFKKIFKQDNFKNERSYRKVILMIGPTGYGKSTVCNRLIGNTDHIFSIRKSESCPFKVANKYKTKVVTTKLTKVAKKVTIYDHSKIVHEVNSFEVSVIDTPGLSDPDGNDKYLIDDTDVSKTMKKYFNACGGINLFCIFFKYDGRMDKDYIKKLNDHQKFWGKNIWKHCCIIITNCDKDTEMRKREVENDLPETKNEIKQKLNEISGDLCNDIKMYDFGLNNFKKSTKDLLILLKRKDKYICDNIRCEINDLWEQQQQKQDSLKDKLDTAINEWEELDAEQTKIDDIMRTTIQ